MAKAAANKVTVQVDQHFPTWGRNLDDAIKRALDEHAAVMAEEAKGRSVSGYQYEGDIVVVPAEKTERGYTVAVGDANWKAGWFEKGTAAHSVSAGARGHHSLTSSGRKRRKAAGLVSGVRPSHRLRNANYALKRVLIERLRVNMSRARV